MTTAPKPATSGRRLTRILWSLGRVYWGSPDAKVGVLLLALVIALAAVYTNVLLAGAERDVLDALEQRQAAAFFAFTGIFLVTMIDRFRKVIANWWQLIRVQRNLSLLTTGIGQANRLVPLLVAAPGYIAGHLTLGRVAQIRFAYGQVSGALNANIERLVTFAEVMDATERDLGSAGIQVPAEGAGLRLEDLRVDAPDGHVLFEHASAMAAPGDRIAIAGPSGAGKTTLLRALAGIWPFGRGRVELPAGARILFLPQRPYLPGATLSSVAHRPAVEAYHAKRWVLAPRDHGPAVLEPA